MLLFNVLLNLFPSIGYLKWWWHLYDLVELGLQRNFHNFGYFLTLIFIGEQVSINPFISVTKHILVNLIKQTHPSDSFA